MGFVRAFFDKQDTFLSFVIRMSDITANIQQKLFYAGYWTYVDVFRLKRIKYDFTRLSLLRK